MYCEWSGHCVKLYDENRTHHRTYFVPQDIVGVQVSGEGNNCRVAVTMVNGHTYLYKGDGTLIRK